MATIILAGGEKGKRFSLPNSTIHMHPALEVGPPLLLTLADGETLVAREVDLGQPGEHRLLLTRKGYVLVNAAGEVIYRL